MSDTRPGRWRRRVLVLTLLGLIALGVIPALVSLWITPGAARVPDDPEAFVAHFGEPDGVDRAEPTGRHTGSATRSLVYRKAGVRADFAFGARGGKWSFAGFRDPTSGQELKPQEAVKMLDAARRAASKD